MIHIALAWYFIFAIAITVIIYFATRSDKVTAKVADAESKPAKKPVAGSSPERARPYSGSSALLAGVIAVSIIGMLLIAFVAVRWSTPPTLLRTHSLAAAANPSRVSPPRGYENRWAPTTPMWQWPTLKVRAHGKSKRIEVPPGMEIKYYLDPRFLIHNVDADGNECTNRAVEAPCSGDNYKWEYLTTESGDDLAVPYAYAPDKY